MRAVRGRVRRARGERRSAGLAAPAGATARRPIDGRPDRSSWINRDRDEPRPGASSATGARWRRSPTDRAVEHGVEQRAVAPMLPAATSAPSTPSAGSSGTRSARSSACRTPTWGDAAVDQHLSMLEGQPAALRRSCSAAATTTSASASPTGRATAPTWASVVFADSKDHTAPKAEKHGTARSGRTVTLDWTGHDRKLQTHTAGLASFDVQVPRRPRRLAHGPEQHDAATRSRSGTGRADTGTASGSGPRTSAVTSPRGRPRAASGSRRDETARQPTGGDAASRSPPSTSSATRSTGTSS